MIADIPGSVTEIGSGAFYGCAMLIDVVIPNSITYISSQVFCGCTHLHHVAIPNSVTFINDSAFEDCSWLTEVTIPDSVTVIGDNVFKGCYYLKKVYIPNSVKSIGDNAFKGCTRLKKVIIPNSVTCIRNESFAGCSNLHELSISDSVYTIGDSAFEGCYNLRKISIPQNVQIIREKAFWGCPIKEVSLPVNTEYDTNSFDEVTKVIKAKVSISYSWDDDEHKKWVRNLANDLTKKGVYVILDQWKLKLGHDMNHFMEKAISESERVICVFTSNYRKKAEKLEGGVGYEYSIITAEMSKDLNGNKVIPILREGSKENSCPIMFKNRLYLDFRQEDSYENSLDLLLREIFKVESF